MDFSRRDFTRYLAASIVSSPYLGSLLLPAQALASPNYRLSVHWEPVQLILNRHNPALTTVLYITNRGPGTNPPDTQIEVRFWETQPSRRRAMLTAVEVKQPLFPAQSRDMHWDESGLSWKPGPIPPGSWLGLKITFHTKTSGRASANQVLHAKVSNDPGNISNSRVADLTIVAINVSPVRRK